MQNKSSRALILHDAWGPRHNPMSSFEGGLRSSFPNVGNLVNIGWEPSGTCWEQLGNMLGTSGEQVENNWETQWQ
jgi:hypothetical protein